MGTGEKIKEYSNAEITIVWQPAKCIHAAECVKALPEVYDPEAKPWIKIENATTDELKAQISKCPSGALSFRDNDGAEPEDTTYATKVKVLENGPLLIYGSLKITDKNGNQEQRNKTTAFCRCGASKNKPFCDGSHTEVDFSG